MLFWLVVSTHLKNISQNGSFPQVGMNIKNIWNHHLALLAYEKYLFRVIFWEWSSPNSFLKIQKLLALVLPSSRQIIGNPMWSEELQIIFTGLAKSKKKQLHKQILKKNDVTKISHFNIPLKTHFVIVTGPPFSGSSRLPSRKSGSLLSLWWAGPFGPWASTLW